MGINGAIDPFTPIAYHKWRCVQLVDCVSAILEVRTSKLKLEFLIFVINRAAILKLIWAWHTMRSGGGWRQGEESWQEKRTRRQTWTTHHHLHSKQLRHYMASAQIELLSRPADKSASIDYTVAFLNSKFTSVDQLQRGSTLEDAFKESQRNSKRLQAQLSC